MVHNPIYVGDEPVYESVENQKSQPRDAALQYDNIYCTEETHTFQDDSYLSGNRYIDQPVHFHNNLFAHTNNTTDDSRGTFANAPNSTTCASVPSTRKMAIKRNGQQRNKLHLTLSLPGSYSIPMKEIRNNFPRSTEIQAEVADETYTVMNPAGAVHLTSNSRSVNDRTLHKDDIQHVE